MQADYKVFIDRVIQKYEGGYGWDKSDPGGPTKYGITCYDLAEFRQEKMSSMAVWAPKVRAMSLDTAAAIYATKYAAGVNFDALPVGVDCCLLDYGINSGVSRPVRVVRALLNMGSGDRFTGSLLQAVQKADPTWLVDSVCKERLHFLQGLRIWGDYHNGWTARVNDLERYCEHLIKVGAPAPAPTTPVPTVPKGTHPVTPTGPKAGGVVAGGAAGGAALHATGLPTWVILGLLGVGVAGGVALVLWQQHKAVAANAQVVLPPNIKPHP